MKIIISFLAAILFLGACSKQNSSNDRLSAADLSASANMSAGLTLMQQSLNNLISSANAAQRHHWDSLYHTHDALFWQHHNNYHHNTYTHDDHSHSWVPYDANVNHQNHYHHQYPNHANDSLVTIHNNHHYNNTDHHHQGHDFKHHQLLDSLHHIHTTHHP